MFQRISQATQFARVAVVALVIALSMAGMASAADGKVNVNTATAEQLELLPRIGPAVAKRIIDYREAEGPFRQLEDLMLVEGIGDKTFDLLRPYVVLEGKTTLAEKVRPPRKSASNDDSAINERQE